MKNLVLLAALFGVIAVSMALTKEEIKEKVHEFKTECIAETGATEEELKKAKKEQKLEKDSKVPDFLVCFFKKCGLLNADGEIDAETTKTKLTTILGEEKATEVTEECTKDKPEAGHDAAIHLATCLHKHHHEEDDDDL